MDKTEAQTSGDAAHSQKEPIYHPVDWSPRKGGVCPRCGQENCPVTGTKPWHMLSNTLHYRKRQHLCSSCNLSFQSFQESD